MMKQAAMFLVIQTGGPALMQQLDTKCKLSQRAQLLLAVSDQAAGDGGEVVLSRAALGEPLHKVRHSHSHHRHSQQSDQESSHHWLLG
jgi:hypothetical protein